MNYEELPLEKKCLIQSIFEIQRALGSLSAGAFGVTGAVELGLLSGGCRHPYVTGPITGKNVLCHVCGFEVAH